MRSSQPWPWLAEMATRRAEAERVEVGRDGIGVESFCLVQRQRDRLARAAQLARDEVVLWREAGARVGEKYQAVSLEHRALGLRAHLRLDALRVLEQPAGIDNHVGHGPEATEAILAVAREARYVRDDGIACAGEHVEQCRLADIRPADQSDDRQHGAALSGSAVPAVYLGSAGVGSAGVGSAGVGSAGVAAGAAEALFLPCAGAACGVTR